MTTSLRKETMNPFGICKKALRGVDKYIAIVNKLEEESESEVESQEEESESEIEESESEIEEIDGELQFTDIEVCE